MLAPRLPTGKRHIHKVIVLTERRHGEKLCNEPQSREVIMPTERESIEAELRERERLITKCLGVLEGIKDLEADLERLEAEHGLPEFYRAKPLVERLAHLGMSQDAINDIKELLDAMSAIPSGRDVSERAKQLIAEQADAMLARYPPRWQQKKTRAV